MRNKDGNLIFENVPYIASCAAVVGKKEGEGPLRDYFDRIIHDSYAGKDDSMDGNIRFVIETDPVKG
jgi:hypothetical protein